MTDKLRLTEMLCTRFCHDIIGPVGALNNGAEFLREELKDSASQAADLIESSAKEAVARVQFYRQAYGHGNNANPANLGETRTLAQNYFEAGKIKLDWADEYIDDSKYPIQQLHKKLLLNLFVIASSSLIRGGTITLTINDGRITLLAKGDKCAMPQNSELVLRGKLPQEEIDPRLIQCHYTFELASENKKPIEVSKDGDSVVLSFAI